MAKQNRIKTKYAGVHYVECLSAQGKVERVFYIRYRKGGKPIEEKAGRQFQDDMTAARAAGVRARRIEGELSNTEHREAEQLKMKAESNRYTIDRLWDEYKINRRQGKSFNTDEGRYLQYLQPIFGKKEPREIIKLDMDRLRIKLSKTLSPQSVKHILSLFSWIVNYGTKNNLCQGINFHIQKPTVNNEKTEDLTPDQLDRLLQAIDEDENTEVGQIMKMALFTGMRRNEIFKLEWKDLNFETGFILIRDPKGGIDQKIPMNQNARDILENRSKKSPFVFPGPQGKKRTTIGISGRRILERAGLPKDFRPLHGLRHVYASLLASSGQVDMYVIQRLMTHKTPKMTQRYAHLRDESLKNGAEQIDEIMKKQTEPKIIKFNLK